MDNKIVAKGVSKVHVSARRGERVEALLDVDLTVAAGEFVTILGPSGCGKSTLLRLVAGLDTPTDGELLYDGKAVRGPDFQRGMLFQAYALFPWMSIRDNVEFGPRSRRLPAAQYRPRAQHLLELVGLAGFEDRYPHELSGGMQQRGALARLFANDPDVLLMDEPLAAVDAQTRELLQEELARLWGEYRKTVLFVTHSVEEAVFLSDRIVVMSRRPGRIKEIVDVALPRIRTYATRESEEYHRQCTMVGRLIREEIQDKRAPLQAPVDPEPALASPSVPGDIGRR